MTTTLSSCPDALALAETIAQRCEDAHPYQDEWRARCPNHQGKSDTSLSVTPQEDRVLVHCHGGCDVQAIVHALGLTLADLFVRKPEQRNGHRRIAKTYDYYDATGTLVHQTVRYDPKDFKQRRPDPVTPGAWVWKLDGIKPVLYRLAQVLTAIERGETIYVSEGEKDVETLESVGLTATCNPMGAGSWRPWYSETLRGCDVVILPDHDEKGAKHAQQIAVSLAGIARSVKVVPGIHTAASGSDVSDWLPQGGSREALDAAVQACPAWTPEDAAPAGQPERPRFTTISAPALAAKVLPVQRWIIEGILPAGAGLFTGRGKDGKSLAVWNLSIAVATEGLAFGRYPVDAGDVLYLALEDGERRAQARLKEQMRAMGDAEIPERLELVLWDAPRMGEGFEDALTTWLDEHPDARLVVIDILEKVRPKRTRNGSVYADDYAALAPLQRIAQDRNIAVLIVHHSNKTKPEDYRDTASGSMGLIGGCDTFWSLSRVAGEPDACLRIIGRDVEPQELALKFQDGFWTALGDADDYRLSETSKAILAALVQAREPLTPKQVAARLQKPEGTMRQQLTRMQERGEVHNIGNGRYIPASSYPTPPATPPPPPSRERDGGRESRETGVTHVTGVTGVTGVTHVTLGEEPSGCVPLAPESYTCEGGGVTLSLDPEAPLSNGKDDDFLRDSVTGVTGVTPVTGDGTRACAPVLKSLPSMGSRCPDGRSHNWIRRGELPRLCCQCNAEEVPA